MQPENEIIKLNIDLLIPNPYQPRKNFNDETLKELAASIKEYGILNPILVRKKDNLYEIIAGERRYRAAKLLGLKEVPVIVKEIDEKKLAEIALIENLQRENITPIEEAKSYQDILKLSNLKEEELSNIIGKSQPYISNKLRLLKLPQNIQDALINKKISERHARTLISVNDSGKQTELLNRIIKEKLTVKELETIINEKEITDEEIKSAIDDIMKSLNINLDSNNQTKKEEKESDNMNNGNFFPNQQNNIPDGNMTLNAMNMQTLNQIPTNQTAGVVPQMPEPSPMPSFEQPFVYNQPAVNSEPVVTVQEPAPTTLEPTQMPNFGPMPEPSQMPSFEIPNPIPNFEPQPVVPEMNTQPVMPTAPEMPAEVINSTPIGGMDQPLFNPNIEMPQAISEPVTPSPVVQEPVYEVPVTTEISQPANKLAEVENYLTNNGINYKKYSNETGNCIIIEL